MFSLGMAPIVDNARWVISILTFGLMLVAEENQFRENQEARDGATSLTPVAVRASKRKFPTVPKTIDKVERLLSRFIKSWHILFICSCHHFQEVVHMKQEFLLMFRRNGGHLPASTIVSLVWDIITDSVQFFYTFLTEE